MAVSKTSNAISSDGVLEEINITLGNTRVVNFASPYPTTPNATPAVAQVSITVTGDMFPDIPGCGYLAIPYVYVYGKNILGANSVLSYSLLRNGEAQQNGSGTITSNQQFCVAVLRNTGVQVGDVFEFKVWSATAGFEIHGGQMTIVPSRIMPQDLPLGAPIKDMTVTMVRIPIAPADTGIGFTSGWTGNWNCIQFSTNGIGFSAASGYVPIYFNNSTYGIGCVQGGDINNPWQTTNSHATLYSGSSCYLATKITYRRVYL